MDSPRHPYRPSWTPLPGFITERDDFATAIDRIGSERPMHDQFDPYLEPLEPVDVTSLGFYLSFRWSNSINEHLNRGAWGGFVSGEGTYALAAMLVEDGCGPEHAWDIAWDVAVAQVSIASVFDRALFNIEHLSWLLGREEPFGDSPIIDLLTEQRHSMSLLANWRVGIDVRKRHGDQSWEFHSYLNLVMDMEDKQFRRLHPYDLGERAIVAALDRISTRDLSSHTLPGRNPFLWGLGLADHSDSPSGSRFTISHY